VEATILDLRYKMHDVLTALNRHEKVTIKYHGKVKGVIVPLGAAGRRKSLEHPLFGMLKDETESPAAIVSKMRRAR
jgi:hypothetical protein